MRASCAPLLPPASARCRTSRTAAATAAGRRPEVAPRRCGQNREPVRRRRTAGELHRGNARGPGSGSLVVDGTARVLPAPLHISAEAKAANFGRARQPEACPIPTKMAGAAAAPGVSVTGAHGGAPPAVGPLRPAFSMTLDFPSSRWSITGDLPENMKGGALGHFLTV